MSTKRIRIPGQSSFTARTHATLPPIDETRTCQHCRHRVASAPPATHHYCTEHRLNVPLTCTCARFEKTSPKPGA